MGSIFGPLHFLFFFSHFKIQIVAPPQLSSIDVPISTEVQKESFQTVLIFLELIMWSPIVFHCNFYGCFEDAFGHYQNFRVHFYHFLQKQDQAHQKAKYDLWVQFNNSYGIQNHHLFLRLQLQHLNHQDPCCPR